MSSLENVKDGSGVEDEHVTAAPMAVEETSAPKQAEVEDFPDPGEDDLDDLDGIGYLSLSFRE